MPWLRAVSAAATLCVAAATWAAPAASRVPSTAVSAGAHEAHGHGHAHDVRSSPQALAERRRLIAEGEARLRAGDVAAARLAFEQAAQSAHEAEIELGWLRMQMQAGEYRQALAFAAHTAGVHLDHVEGAAFYAWLLNLGAQVQAATQTLDGVQARAPGHPLVQAVQQRWQSGALAPSADMLRLPARLAPYATGAQVPPGARVVATGLLLADGGHVLVPRAALPEGLPGAPSAEVRLWLRNGLGQTVEAQLEAKEASDGASLASEVVMLRLTQTLPVGGGEVVASRDAAPGTPAYAVDLPANQALDQGNNQGNNQSLDAAGEPAWPVMRAGFLGLPLAAAQGKTRLGVALPGRGLRGGPVYDQGGRLIGVALGQMASPGQSGKADQPNAHLPDLLLPVSALRARFGERFGRVAPPARPTPVGADELYELVLRSSLQVLALPVSVPPAVR
ncbi:MAG: hypothetical protein IIA02_03375 [Proteobacteria bacterium]|nr:hypothetical protein [Pseudomonadota bacterium]